jgi:hypothetical protein
LGEALGKDHRNGIAGVTATHGRAVNGTTLLGLCGGSTGCQSLYLLVVDVILRTMGAALPWISLLCPPKVIWMNQSQSS